MEELKTLIYYNNDIFYVLLKETLKEVLKNILV